MVEGQNSRATDMKRATTTTIAIAPTNGTREKRVHIVDGAIMSRIGVNLRTVHAIYVLKLGI